MVSLSAMAGAVNTPHAMSRKADSWVAGTTVAGSFPSSIFDNLVNAVTTLTWLKMPPSTASLKADNNAGAVGAASNCLLT